jgi:ADP-ribose pyrophosphatase YjhB (NUDIX family)
MDSSELPLQVGVKALLKNGEGKYLLIRRNPEKYPDMPFSWDIPGGRIHINISLLENLKREIKEEIGLELIKTLKLISAQDIMRPTKHVVRLTYAGEIDGQPVLDTDHTEYGWFALEEMKALKDIDPFLLEALSNLNI